MEPRLLQEIGLTKTESIIYWALLQSGPSLAGRISRQSGIHRRSVYDAMDRLIEKGLVSYILKNNQRYYQAANPEKLLQLVKDRERIVSEILPELKAQYGFSKEKEETNFYVGKEGIKYIFEDMLKEKDTVLVIGASANVDQIVKYYFPKYDKRRVKEKVRVRLIYDKSFRPVKGIPLSEIRYLPEGYGSNAATNIYSDKVAIIIWVERPLAILIKNKEVAKSYRKYFELLWKIAKD
jgi:sugar-specific transcriptional regulator TrmB